MSESLSPIIGHSESQSLALSDIRVANSGMSLTWFCSFGYLGGAYFSAAPVAVTALLNTSVATSFAVLSWYAMDIVLGQRIKPSGMCYGVVSGLAAISAPAGTISLLEATVNFIVPILPI